MRFTGYEMQGWGCVTVRGNWCTGLRRAPRQPTGGRGGGYRSRGDWVQTDMSQLRRSVLLTPLPENTGFPTLRLIDLVQTE